MAVSFDVERAAVKALQLRDASKLGELLESRQGLIRHPFKNRGGRTLVHLAAQDGCTPCLCKLLGTRGCNPDARSDYADGGQTALHLAAQSGRGECIRLLLEHNANPLIRDMGGQRTPLDIARSRHFARCVKLLEEGEAKYMKDNSLEEKLKQKLAATRSDMEHACLDVNSQGLVEVFEKYDQMILRMVAFQQKDASEDSLIFQLARAGREDLVSACLDHLGQPLTRPSTSETLLHFACTHCNDEVVKTVFHHFPNMVSMADCHGSTALHVLAAKNRPGLIKLLAKPSSHDNRKSDTPLQALCNLNALDEHGHTPLHVACASGNLDTVKALLEQEASRNETTSINSQQGLNVNCFAKTGRTPLHEAVWNGGCELVALLIKHGADVHALASPTVEAESIIRKAAEAAKEVTASLYFRSSRATSRSIVASLPTYSSIDSETCNNHSCIDDIPICGRPRTFAIRITNSRMNMSKSLFNTASSYAESRGMGSSRPFGGSQGRSVGNFCGKIEGRSRVESLSAAAVDFKKMKSQISPLVEACVQGDKEKVECLLQAGAVDKHGLALCVSMFQGFEVITQRLLSRPNGLRSGEAQGNGEDSLTNAVAVTWSGLGLVQIDPEWVTDRYLAGSTGISHPCSLSDSVETAVSPAVTPYFEPTLQTVGGSSLQPITWLNLSSNKLLYVPAEVFRLENLICLDMSVNCLTELPVDCGSDSALQGWSCCSLTSLNLSRNALFAVPNCLWKLSKVVNINLADNRLSSLATDADMLPEEELVTLKVEFKLKTLNVSHNCLQTLPTSLFFYPLLEELTASQNELEHLPTSMWTAPALKSLDLSQNNLCYLPVESTLEGRRQTMSFHNELMRSGSSGVRHNRAATMKRAASTVPKSSWVEVTHKSSGILSFTPEKDNCLPLPFSGIATVAKKLNPGENGTVVSSYWMISEDAGQEQSGYKCSGLTSLKLARNRFSTVPVGLPCLAPNLVNLDMSHNKMRRIGNPCSYPAQIESLNLAHNQLVTMDLEGQEPSTVCYGIQIEDNSFNYHCSHQCHETLCRLKSLNLKGNHLSSLCLQLPESPYMTQRSATMARASMVEELEVQHLRLLYPSLHRLDLAQNYLGSVPPALGYQEELQFLDLQGNPELSDLPLELGRLKQKLFSLRVDADRIRVPPPGIANGSSQQILTYLYALKQESAEHRQLKLTVVGYERRGKTSLLMRLRGVRASKQQPSTKGVELAEWTLEEPRGHRDHSKGKGNPVTFITYDFAGQVEYYATHQCFLSEQSLYLVVWNSTGGEDEVKRIRQWLLNIEARAPGSPVIIVATHIDQLPNRPFRYKSKDEYLQNMRDLIKTSYQDKASQHGLPCVLTIHEVSCTSRFSSGIEELRESIYKIVVNLEIGDKGKVIFKHEHQPGSHLLLEQKVPASYLKLQRKVKEEASLLHSSGEDPVIQETAFRNTVCQSLFEDDEEMKQATRFLHQRGTLLHYNEPALKGMYFIDPQWLGKMLANVITIKEENSFVSNGLIKREDLIKLFQDRKLTSHKLEAYISLMSKFEVAMPLSNDLLLIPSHLPSGLEHAKSVHSQQESSVLTSCFSRASCHISDHIQQELTVSTSSLTSLVKEFQARCRSESLLESGVMKDKLVPYFRFWMMSYVPSGFWPRLMCKITTDSRLKNSLSELGIIMLDEMDGGFDVEQTCCAQWLRWSDGVQLYCMESILMQLQQKGAAPAVAVWCEQSGSCVPLDGKERHFVECIELTVFVENLCKLFHNQIRKSMMLTSELNSLTVSDIYYPLPDTSETFGYEEGVLEANALKNGRRVAAEILVIVSRHISSLIEDWFPGLVDRLDIKHVHCIIPCVGCMLSPPPGEESAQQSTDLEEFPTYSFLSSSRDHPASITQSKSNVTFGSASSASELTGNSYESTTATTGDSGHGNTEYMVHPHSEGWVDVGSVAWQELIGRSINGIVFEDGVISISCGQKEFYCHRHGSVRLDKVAPDLIFNDLPSDCFKHNSESSLVHKEGLESKLLGRGGYGAVYRARLQNAKSGGTMKIAVKVFNADHSHHSKRSSAASKALESYNLARQELDVLIHIKHPYILRLVGVGLKPLALLLEYAEKGNLQDNVKIFKESHVPLTVLTVQKVLSQVAAGICYLHSKAIIHRDLKPDNVLVWKFPSSRPGGQQVENGVLVKLADYGISRLSGCFGTRDTGEHTARYTAPELLQYAGRAPYDEKVDVFSFAMVVYYIISCKEPLWKISKEQADRAIVLGERPKLTVEELHSSPLTQDVMMACWQHQPDFRPSMSQIKGVIDSPTFCRVTHVLSVPEVANRLVTVCHWKANEDSHPQVWLCGGTGTEGTVVVATLSNTTLTEYKGVCTSKIVAACTVNNSVWLGTRSGSLLVYKLNPNDSAQLAFSELSYPLCPGPIVAIQHSPEQQLVGVAVTGGLLILYSVQKNAMDKLDMKAHIRHVDPAQPSATANCIHFVSHSGVVELWCGLSSSKIAAFIVQQDSSGMVINPAGEVGTSTTSRQQPYGHSVACYHETKGGLSTRLWFGQMRRPQLKWLDPKGRRTGIMKVGDLVQEEDQSKLCITTMATWRAEVLVGVEGGYIIIIDSLTCTCQAVLTLYNDKVLAIIPRMTSKVRLDNKYQVISYGVGFRSLSRMPKGDKYDETADFVSWEGGKW